MNAERLLAHFERIADAPDAVARLRRFILDLAVRGRLVLQNPEEKLPSEILKRLRKLQVLAVAPKRREASFEIPSNWVWTHLGSIGEWGSGSTPTRGNSDLYGGPITWLKSGELNDNRRLAGSEETLTEMALRTGSFRLNRPGDVLFAMYGATIGKIAILAEAAVTNQAVCGCTPIDGVFNEFLFFFLLSQREQLRRSSEGGAQPNLSKIKIVRTPFPLPPTSEQHRIVQRVDVLMSLCDRLEAARTEGEAKRERLTTACFARVNTSDPDAARFAADARFALNVLPTLTARREQIQQLRQTILSLAVRGKLIPQDSQDEPAVTLHDRLKALRFSNSHASIRKSDILPSAATFFEQSTFPTSWFVTHFDYVNDIASGVAKGKNLRGVRTETYPYLRVANVQRGYLDLGVVKELEIRADEISKYRLQHGDVLMTEGGDWDKLGRAAIWNDEIRDCIHQNHIYRIRSKDPHRLLPKWIVLFANSPLGRSYFEAASKKTTNLASINMTQLRSCPLALPPTAEQFRIVRKVDELMTLCDRLEASLSTAETTRSRLLAALLAGALAPTASEIQVAQ